MPSSSRDHRYGMLDSHTATNTDKQQFSPSEIKNVLFTMSITKDYRIGLRSISVIMLIYAGLLLPCYFVAKDEVTRDRKNIIQGSEFDVFSDIIEEPSLPNPSIYLAYASFLSLLCTHYFYTPKKAVYLSYTRTELVLRLALLVESCTWAAYFGLSADPNILIRVPYLARYIAICIAFEIYRISMGYLSSPTTYRSSWYRLQDDDAEITHGGSSVGFLYLAMHSLCALGYYELRY